MLPIHTQNTTTVLNKPADWDENKFGKCIGLPIVKVGAFNISYWHVPVMDRLRILFGRPIRLTIISTDGHPPVAIDTEKC